MRPPEMIRRVAVTSALVCLITAVLAFLTGPMASVAVGSVWVLAVLAGALRWVAVSRREPVVVTPPREQWPVITPLPPVGPPPHRFDKAIVLAAINGRPLKREPTIHERHGIAVVCSWLGYDVDQIADNLRCSAEEVEMLLAIAEPLEAVSR